MNRFAIGKALKTLGGAAGNFSETLQKKSRAEKQADLLQSQIATLGEDSSQFEIFADAIRNDPDNASDLFDSGLKSIQTFKEDARERADTEAFNERFRGAFGDDKELSSIAGLIGPGVKAGDVLDLIQSVKGNRSREEAARIRKSSGGGKGGSSDPVKERKTAAETLKALGLGATDFEDPSEAFRFAGNPGRYGLERNEDGRYRVIDKGTRTGRRTGSAGEIDDLIQEQKVGPVSGFLRKFGL